MADTTFDDFVTATLPELLSFAHRLTADAGEAEDLVQAGLVRTMNRWSAIQRREDPLNDIRRFLARTHVSRWRRPWSRVTVGPAPAHASPDQLGFSSDQDEVRLALRSLPARQRASLVLHLHEGMGEAAIAELLGCRPRTAKAALSRGLAAIADRLGAVRPPVDIEAVGR